jgi:hypothetical protein
VVNVQGEVVGWAVKTAKMATLRPVEQLLPVLANELGGTADEVCALPPCAPAVRSPPCVRRRAFAAVRSPPCVRRRASLVRGPPS